MTKKKNKVPTPGKPKKPKRSEAQRERDFPTIAELYLQGHTQKNIAAAITEGKKYTLTIATISKDIKHIEAAWLESTLIDFGEAKARELAKLDLAEAELWGAWHRSKEPKKTKIKEGVKKETGKRVGKKSKPQVLASGKTLERSEERDPNPRYMDLILDIVEKRLRILGAFAPEAHVYANVDLNALDQARHERWQENKGVMLEAIKLGEAMMPDSAPPVVIEGQTNGARSKNGKAK